jgi:Zn-dependent metalloprotease
MRLVVSNRIIKFSLSIALCLFTSFVYAAEVIDLRNYPSELFQKVSGIPSFQKKSDSSKELEKLSEYTDTKDQTHARYQQFYQGIPVFGLQVLTHQKKNDQNLSGKFVLGIEKDIPVVEKDTDLKSKNLLAELKSDYQKKYDGKLIWNTENEHAKAVIFLDQNSKAHLAYYISFSFIDLVSKTFSRPSFLVDAHTKAILKSWEGMHSYESDKYNKVVKAMGPGGNLKTGWYEYGKDKPFLQVTHDIKGTCHLYNDLVKIVDWSNFMEPQHPQWQCGSQMPYHEGDAINGAASPANDALFFGTYTLNTFKLYFGETGIKPRKLVINLHMGMSDGARWDGSAILIGDGDDEAYPFTTLDVIAHEIGHAVSDNYSNLIGEGESGALDESFSDIMAKSIEAIYNKTISTPKKVNWVIGADVNKDGTPFRYFDDPSKDGVSIGHIKDFTASLDPHYASGIFNRVFYLMANSPVPDNSFPPMMRASFEGFVRANKVYWYPTITLTDAAWGLAQAMEDLYGSKGASVAISALEEVGINCSGRCGINGG